MSTELQVLGHEKGRADMFFDRVPIVTDWSAVREMVKSGVITVASALQKIHAYEPMQEHDPLDHKHWIDQQHLRLALLHEAGKPLELEITCETCGSCKADPLYGEKYDHCCLHCAERDRQVPYNGGRGSCEFLRACYNPRSHSWGLLYYWSHYDRTFIFWLADFYKNRQEAEAAMQPFYHYDMWLKVKYKGMNDYCREFSRLIPIDAAMNLPLPFTPDQFRDHLRQVIEEDMGEEHRVMRYYVRSALDDHARANRD